MSKSSIQAPGALIKHTRKGIIKVDAVSIKPPVVKADPTGGDKHTYLCAYVTDKFQMVKQPCTFEVWKRCEGRQTPGRVRNGLESKLHNDFVIIQDATTNEVIDIDVIPKTYYTSKASLPDYLEGKEDILVTVQPKTGTLEVTQCPAGVSKLNVRKLLNSLDAAASLETGASLPGGFEILNVSGNQLSISPPSFK